MEFSRGGWSVEGGVRIVGGFLQLIEEVAAGDFLIAVGYEFTSLTRLVDEGLEGSHLMDNRHPCLMALLHGRDDNLLNARQFDHLALRELTVEEREFIDTYLCRLLRHPLHTVHHLRRSNSQMNVALPLALLWQRLHNLIATAVRGSFCDPSTVVVPYPIHEEQLVAHLEP